MRFLLRVQLALLLAGAAGLALLFGLTDYASLAARVARPNFGLYGGLVSLALTPARYQALRLGLAATALVAALSLGLSRPAGRRAGGSGRWLAAALARPWQRLRPAERALALGLVGGVAVVRLYYAGYYPLSLDELASYDFCVLPGAAVTASYYPFPNNHLFPNLLGGGLHALLPGASPRLGLRLLPTLLGLAALPVTYALVLRYLRFGVATLGLGLYWLSPMAVYYAVAGRGYAWTLTATLAGLLATLELLRPGGVRRPVRRLAWAGFGLSGVLGLYAVPTHLYALLGLGLGLLVGFSRAPARVRGLRLGQLAVATAGLAAGALVLYAPVGAVSGWPALLANRYVARHAGPGFVAGIGPWLVGTATELLGQRGLSTAAYLLVLALAPAALRWGRLPEPARRLGWLLLAQLGLWLPLVLGQRVYPPARTLLPVLLAFFLLVALLGQAGWARWRPVGEGRPAGRLAPVGPLLLLGLLGAYGGYRLHREQAIITALTRQQLRLRDAYAWLRTQPLRRIWVEPRAYAIFWGHYAVSAGQPPLPLVVVYDVAAPRPGPTGEVEVLQPGARRAGPLPAARYRNEQVLIVPVSPTQPLISD